MEADAQVSSIVLKFYCTLLKTFAVFAPVLLKQQWKISRLFSSSTTVPTPIFLNFSESNYSNTATSLDIF